MKVCNATNSVELSGIRRSNRAAVAAETNAPAWRKPGPRPTTDDNNGSTGGASSMTLGKIGNNSGPEASTRTKISGFVPASFNRGSKLERDIPASWALESSPLLATSLNKDLFSMDVRSSFTAMLFPNESNSGVFDGVADRATKLARCCEIGATKAVALLARSAKVCKQGKNGEKNCNA
eukprot:CAMPEP_0172421844 /NCGR_PEP_ID=MMETSP1064-20121228/8066_1 /TAXON_ID=202472 /ORGANISM="Aulacoseira subarctica , Strain CCAP 1002/5" /LENGTH=178 /DNA_ID=CAMNT_0013162433 /DNA_START=289 /DNA_END=825 /DNA_ORIENTATION=-